MPALWGLVNGSTLHLPRPYMSPFILQLQGPHPPALCFLEPTLSSWSFELPWSTYLSECRVKFKFSTCSEIETWLKTKNFSKPPTHKIPGKLTHPWNVRHSLHIRYRLCYLRAVTCLVIWEVDIHESIIRATTTKKIERGEEWRKKDRFSISLRISSQGHPSNVYNCCSLFQWFQRFITFWNAAEQIKRNNQLLFMTERVSYHWRR